MDKELRDIIDAYISAFLNQDDVRRYFALEKEINESSEIESLQKRIRTAQKAMALAMNDDPTYERLKAEYLDLRQRLDSHPLVCNYNLLKEEIYRQLKSLETELKRKD